MGIASFSFPCIRRYYGAGVLRPQIEPKSNEVVYNSESSIRYLDKARIDFSLYVTNVVLNEPSKENEMFLSLTAIFEGIMHVERRYICSIPIPLVKRVV